MNTQAKKMQKIAIGVWTAAVALFIVESILRLYPAFVRHSARSLVFNDALKQLLVTLLYGLVAFYLFRLIYTRKGAFINLVSEEGLAQLRKIWSALLSLLLTKVVANEIIVRYVLPKAEDASLAQQMGYLTRQGLRLQPHADLIIAIVMVWIFMLVLSYSVQLKREQELTI